LFDLPITGRTSIMMAPMSPLPMPMPFGGPLAAGGAGLPAIPVSGAMPMPGTLGGTDMSILGTVAQPDLETRMKREAMGLPDPIAFAALAALGAIRKPMAMLNAMMLAAQEKIAKAKSIADAAAKEKEAKEKAALRRAATVRALLDEDGTQEAPKPKVDESLTPTPPPGKSWIQVFQEMQKARPEETRQPSIDALLSPVGGYAAAAQKHRGAQADPDAEAKLQTDLEIKKLQEKLKEQAKEAAEQAKHAREAKEASGIVDEPGDNAMRVSFAFGTGSEPTLKSLLGASGDGPGLEFGSPAVFFDKIHIRHLPPGVTDQTVRAECARHGAVTSVILEADGAAAYASFGNAEMAMHAVLRMSGRMPFPGATKALEVQLTNEIPDSIRLAAAIPETSNEAPVNPADLPDYLKPKDMREGFRRKRSRSKSDSSQSRKRRKQRSKSRKPKRKSWLSRSRSLSHTDTGQYIRATGCSSTVKWWTKKRQSSSSERSRSRSVKKKPKKKSKKDDPKQRPRQVTVRGTWSQFVLNGETYFYDIVNGTTTWDQPPDFSMGPGGMGAPSSCLL